MKTHFIIFVLAMLVASCAKDAPEPEFNPTVASQESEVSEKLDFVYASPAAFTNKALIVYHLKKSGQIKLSINQPGGEELQVIEKGWKDKGLHQFEFYGAFLAEGKYILTLKMNDETITRDVYRLAK